MRRPRPVSFGVDLAAGRSDVREADHVWRPHGMDGWILNLTTDGAGRIGRDGLRVEPGELLLFPPHAPHDYGHDPALRRWVHLWVYFFPRPAWYDWLTWSEAAPGILRLDLRGHDLRPRVEGLFADLVRVAHGAQARREAIAMSLLEQLLLWCDAANPLTRHGALDPRVQRAVEVLCARSSERIPIAALARACDLSPSRLAHLFRAQVGCSPLAWLEQHRLALAREQLILTGRPIAEIAAAVGFRDPVWFTRCFRRRFGRTPRALRRQPDQPLRERAAR